MRVVMLTSVYPRSVDDGTGNFVASLAEAIAAAGAVVTVVAPHDAGCPRRELCNGVRIIRPRYLPERLERVAYRRGIPANLRSSALAVFGLAPFLASFALTARRESRHADVVHAHWAPTAALASLVIGHTPLVLTVHGTDVALAGRGGLWRRLLARATRRSTVVIAVSDSLKRRVAEAIGGDAESRILTIPNGVPASLMDRPRAALPERGTRIAFVGRLTREKGAPDLVSAFLTLGPDVTLVMVGDGPERDALLAEIDRAGARNRVTLTGALPHARALDAIADADVFCLPSQYEGFGLVVLEALALGTPVVATPVGEIPSLLGEDGMLVPIGDVAALSGALAALLADEWRRQRMSDAGRVRAGYYTWRSVAERTLDAYDAASDRT